MESVQDNLCTPEQNVANNCVNCKRPDTADDLVQCDDCQDWWHMSCAMVTKSISDRPWSCRNCLPVSVLSHTTTSSVRAARLQLKLQQLEEKHELEQRHLAEKHRLIEEELSQADDSSSIRSRVSRNLDAVRQWQQTCAEQITNVQQPEETMANTEQVPVEKEVANLPASKQIDAAVRRQEKQVPSKVQSIPAVEQYIHKGDQQLKGSAIYKTVPKSRDQQQFTSAITGTIPKQSRVNLADKGGKVHTQPAPPYPNVQGKSLHDPSIKKNKSFTNAINNNDSLKHVVNQFDSLTYTVAQSHTNACTSETPAVPNLNAITNDLNAMNINSETGKANFNAGAVPSQSGCPSISNITPTPSQLAARQVMARDLPIFTGNPADWPIFISSFVNSTNACGFNGAENLARLQRCLRGPALESVKSRLLLPESVPQIIDTLRLLYGRPELLISALLQSVRSVAVPKAEKLETLIDYGIAVRSLCDHLEAAGQQEHLSNPSLLMELVEKLPVNIKLQWADHMQKQPIVNLKTFGDFMLTIITTVSRVTSYTGGGSSAQQKQKHRGVINAHTSEAEVKQEPTREKYRECICCKRASHKIYDCPTFKSFNVDNRWKFVQNSGLCRSCLNAHGRRSCRNAKQCAYQGCQYRHHPLLHSSRSNTTQSTKHPVVENHTHVQQEQTLMFRIIPVSICGPRATIDTFAFLDDGSSLSLVEDSLVEELGIDGWSKPLCLKWTGSVTRVEQQSKQVRLKISGANKGKKFTLNDVRTVKELTLPEQSLEYEKLVKRFRHLQGIPLASYDKAIPRLLIGVNHISLTVPLQIREGRKDEPIAVKTRLGWCVVGGRDAKKAHALNYHACECSCDHELHNIVRDYFATEDVGVQPIVPLESEDDTRARRILEQTTKRIGDKYETGLIWKYDQIELPDSYSMAVKRFECLERKMARDPVLAANVKKQVEEYEAKRYTHRVTEEEEKQADPKRKWYLPLGVVTNVKKPGKFRLVWDAAAKVDGISLNTMLLKGPDLLVSLPAILLRFRQYCVGVSADIKEMFHQIAIREQDRSSQWFLWRSDDTLPLKIYSMDVAIFGSTCSPTSAQYIKNLNAAEFADEFPRAVEGIQKNHYVDDFLDSFETVEEAARVSNEVRSIHQRGGFQIRNWLSNSTTVLRELKEENPSDIKTFALSSAEGNERVLGLLWCTRDDKLSFSMQFLPEVQALIDSHTRPTKRQMLRCLMGVFDPLGLLSVFLVHGKILLQDVWREGIQWDEMVPDNLFERWLRWTKMFPFISKLKIPRCYFRGANKKTYDQVQIHVFVDASEVAFSAVAYFRIVNVDGKVECGLVASKTKVAPLKPLSVPRLELQAAVLGSRLLTFVQESHSVEIKQRFLWSDSATVLAWLRADHRRYKQYVACRIGELLTKTDVNEWYWVPGKLNPADMATKWINGPIVDTFDTWLKGPRFLYDAEESWPNQVKPIAGPEEELRPCFVISGVQIPEGWIDFQRFSKWSKLLNTAAYIHRFINNCKRGILGKPFEKSWLKQEELKLAKETLVKMVQCQEYADEISSLAGGKNEIRKSSSLSQLSPVLDESGILRVDGRIGAASYAAYDTRYPVILPRKHPVTKLLVDDFHRKYLHGNSETVVNEIRQYYHISQLRTVVKQVAATCQWCKIQRAKPRVPRMGSLPVARLSPFIRPFTYVGIDLFGPLLVKVGRSAVKRWACLFTCLTTRAVHLEVVHSLSTLSCIKSIRRFVCRRGSPAEIHSDNGTNFQGAERLLREQVKKIHEEAAVTFTNTTTRWLFIPPGAPHMGGSWERMVRSIKSAMLAANSADRKLDDESLITLLIEAEAIVNSRPLTYLPLNSEEGEALTPNHFLLGSSSGIRQPVTTLTDSAYALRDSWGLLQQQLDVFWRRWVREYLPTLTTRRKWFGEAKPVAVGDVVVIVEDGQRNGWRRGRVKEIVIAKDGRIRQALIQTARGMLRRPVSKLAVLEVESDGKTGSSDQCYGGENVAAGNTTLQPSPA